MWNKDLIEAEFFSNEIKAILSISLSSTNQSDVIIWRGMSKGVFSVKSAYHLAKAMEEKHKVEGSKQGETSTLWRTIWKLRIPNAEKNFIWRACKEILPTKQNLYRRKVGKDAMCPICGCEDETSFHIIWDCPSARDA